MSSPPASCAQLEALKPAKAQVAGITEVMRGTTPGSLRILAALLFGRAAMTAWRSCGVSTNVLTVSVLLLRSPSYEKKKKALSRPSRKAEAGWGAAVGSGGGAR